MTTQPFANRRRLWTLGLVVLLALAATGIALRGKNRGAEASAAARPAPAAMEFLQEDLVTVAPKALARTLALTGSLAPFTEATVKAKVAGELVAVTVREGESVKAGQVLARIDLTEVQARVAAREADVEAARAQLVWAEKNRSQQKALLDKAFISQSAFDNIQSNYDVAAARLRAAQAELVVAKKSLGDAVLVAPFAGIVSQRLAQPGERVALDARVIGIVDLSRMQLEATVPPAAIGEVKVGQPLRFAVEGFGEREFEGRIERINPAASAGTRSISVYAVIENPQGVLRGGMFARGALRLGQVEGALAIPVSAIREDAGQAYVYLVTEGQVRRRNVKTGTADAAGLVQVTEGLASGDRIVKVNLGALRDGAPARVAGGPADPAKAPAR